MNNSRANLLPKTITETKILSTFSSIRNYFHSVSKFVYYSRSPGHEHGPLISRYELSFSLDFIMKFATMTAAGELVVA